MARAFLEAKEEVTESGGADISSLQSFNDLVADVTSHRHDIKAFAFKTKEMVFFFFLYLRNTSLIRRVSDCHTTRCVFVVGNLVIILIDLLFETLFRESGLCFDPGNLENSCFGESTDRNP